MDGAVSAGSLTELLQPLLFAAAAFASAVVLADTLRCGFAFYVVIGWTLAALFYPHIFLPLYLAFRLFKGRPTQARRRTVGQKLLRVLTPALLYVLVVLTLGVWWRERDEHSFEGYLEQAVAARLRDRHLAAADAYRAALRQQDDAHTHKLLAMELMATRQWAEALEHLRAAERGGEDDEALSFYLAATLDGLKRRDEAVPYYRKFITSSLCTRPVPDERCQNARAF